MCTGSGAITSTALTELPAAVMAGVLATSTNATAILTLLQSCECLLSLVWVPLNIMISLEVVPGPV